MEKKVGYIRMIIEFDGNTLNTVLYHDFFKYGLLYHDIKTKEWFEEILISDYMQFKNEMVENDKGIYEIFAEVWYENFGFDYNIDYKECKIQKLSKDAIEKLIDYNILDEKEITYYYEKNWQSKSNMLSKC